MMACSYCKGEEAFVDERTGVTAYIAFDNDLEIDSDGGTAFWSIKFCPNCGDDLRKLRGEGEGE